MYSLASGEMFIFIYFMGAVRPTEDRSSLRVKNPHLPARAALGKSPKMLQTPRISHNIFFGHNFKLC